MPDRCVYYQGNMYLIKRFDSTRVDTRYVMGVGIIQGNLDDGGFHHAIVRLYHRH